MQVRDEAVGTVVFDRPKLERLKKAYEKAVKNGLEQFDFEGNTLVAGYAKYLVEYLEGKLGP